MRFLISVRLEEYCTDGGGVAHASPLTATTFCIVM